MKKTALNIFFLLLSIALWGQEYVRTYEPSRFTNFGADDEGSYAHYFFKWDDTLRSNFKKVTETKYKVYDTGKIRREFDERHHEEYNDRHQLMFYSYWSDSLHPKDSTLKIYDNHYRLIREVQYKWDDSLKVMEKIHDETMAYNAKGLCLKDSIYTTDVKFSGSSYRHIYIESNSEYEKHIHIHVYDDAGNEVKYKEVNIYGKPGKKESRYDTVVTTYKYDSKGREIFGNRRYNWREYYTYSPTGKELFNAHVSLSYYYKYNDSAWTLSKYNAQDSLIEVEHYNQGVMDSRYTMKFDSARNRIKTEEKLTAATLSACANDKITVTVLDKDGKILSYSTSNLDKGKPDSYMKRHFYKIRNGKVVYDSSASTEFSFLHTSTTEKVEEDTFDMHGNCLGTVKRGGGQYSSSGRETWQYNSKDQVVYSKSYNSCVTDIPEKEEIYTYYADSTSIKEHVVKNDEHKVTSEYGPNGRILFHTQEYHYTWGSGKSETFYEYDK